MAQIPDDSKYPSGDTIQQQLRQLALMDRILGLEAENARLSISGTDAVGPRAEIERLRGELNAVYSSRTWRIGLLVLRPARALRSLGRKNAS